MDRFRSSLAENAPWLLQATRDRRNRQVRRNAEDNFSGVDYAASMQRLSPVFIAFLLLVPAHAAVRYFPHVVAGPAEGFQFETALTLVNSGPPTAVVLDLFSWQGSPMVLDLDPWGQASRFEFDLAQGQTVSARTIASPELKTGYICLTAPDTVDGNAVFAGTYTQGDVLLFEAGVPLVAPVRQLTVLVDSLGDRNTGLAVVCPPDAAEAASLTFNLFDSDHQLVGSAEQDLSPGGKLALFAHELFPAGSEAAVRAQELLGSLEVNAVGAPVAAVTLRQLQARLPFPQQVPTLTTFPVVVTSTGTEEWELVWRDEFDGSQLDLTRWEPEIGRGPNNDGWGNLELQYYTSRPENIQVSQGTLKIIARRETYQSALYTSARLRTRNKGDWKYGRFEFRARLPQGKGIWPAFWMLPTDNVYGGWAASGEIDIMELVGHESHRVHGTLHYGGAWPNNESAGMSYALRQGKFADDFHVFALEWEDGEMRWYVDGVMYLRQTWWRTAGHPFPAPFDQRFHILVNLAVGGRWPGSPDATTVFPQILEVDYVRVYRKLGSDHSK